MISKEALARVLKENNFDQSAIDRILNKRIKTLLKDGNEREIDNILKVLSKKQINKKAIENCLSVLVRGKAQEIEAIFEVLDKKNISKEVIENCLYVLATGKAQEIESIFKVLEERNIKKEVIENCGVNIDFGHKSVEMI